MIRPAILFPTPGYDPALVTRAYGGQLVMLRDSRWRRSLSRRSRAHGGGWLPQYVRSTYVRTYSSLKTSPPQVQNELQLRPVLPARRNPNPARQRTSCQDPGPSAVHTLLRSTTRAQPPPGQSRHGELHRDIYCILRLFQIQIQIQTPNQQRTEQNALLVVLQYPIIH